MDYKTIGLTEPTWKRLWKMRIKNNYKTLEEVIVALLDLEKDFKPELKH